MIKHKNKCRKKQVKILSKEKNHKGSWKRREEKKKKSTIVEGVCSV